MLPTLFHLQDLAGVNLHLRLAISLVLIQPAVTGEHVMLPVNWNHDLNAVQEPTRVHARVGVANHESVELEAKCMLSEEAWLTFSIQHSCCHLANIRGFHGEDVHAALLKVIPQVIV